MNRILVIVVLILLPIAITSKPDAVTEVMAGVTLENQIVEVKKVEEEPPQETTQVLISNNKDKTDPYSLDLEEYIMGVVAGEMPASFNVEALKAQAVAARSFAVNKIQKNEGYVLSTSVNDQVYLTEEARQKKWGSEYEYYSEKIKEAVLETKGEVIKYNEEVIPAYYFAISNGYTDFGEVVFNEKADYLVSVPSTWDKNYQSYKSTYTLAKNTFCNKLNISCNNIIISNIVRSENNYVREITINGVMFSGLQVFNKLNLKSTDFVINVDGDNVSITTYGFGHGVGMSQYGAQGMANEGYSYEEILKHYYQNTKIEQI